MPTIEKNELLDTDALAQILGLAPGTLRTWRWSGAGPKFHRLNGLRGAIRYRGADVESWLSEQTIDPARKVNKGTLKR